jgi:hypothetical protein
MAMKFDGVAEPENEYALGIDYEHEHRDAEHEHEEEPKQSDADEGPRSAGLLREEPALGSGPVDW